MQFWTLGWLLPQSVNQTVQPVTLKLGRTCLGLVSTVFSRKKDLYNKVLIISFSNLKIFHCNFMTYLYAQLVKTFTILALNILCLGYSTSICWRREIFIVAGCFGNCKVLIYHIIISYATSRELWHNSCFVMFNYGGLLSIDLTTSFRVASLALWQSYDCHSNSQGVLKGADKTHKMGSTNNHRTKTKCNKTSLFP